MLDRFNKSSNPLSKQFENPENFAVDYQDKGVLDAPVRVIGEQMTLSGTLNKSLVLIMILVGSAFVAATFFPSQLVMIGSAIGALITAVVVGFKSHLAPKLAPLYAVLEGFFLGIISMHYMAMYDGIVLQAVGLTVSTLIVMLMIYRSGLIPVTQKFKMIVMGATAGIMLMYLATFVLSFFGVHASFLHDGSPMAIGISLLIIGVAALNFLLDFDLIEKGVKGGAPKYMEWFGGFALLVTLAWIYFEFLRLLAMLAGRD